MQNPSSAKASVRGDPSKIREPFGGASAQYARAQPLDVTSEKRATKWRESQITSTQYFGDLQNPEISVNLQPNDSTSPTPALHSIPISSFMRLSQSALKDLGQHVSGSQAVGVGRLSISRRVQTAVCLPRIPTGHNPNTSFRTCSYSKPVRPPLLSTPGLPAELLKKTLSD